MNQDQDRSDERFVAIEIKLAHQEDLVESLNTLVYEQQKRLEQLESLCGALARHIRDSAEAAGGGINLLNERPPHY
jgi:SlyX protein